MLVGVELDLFSESMECGLKIRSHQKIRTMRLLLLCAMVRENASNLQQYYSDTIYMPSTYLTMLSLPDMHQHSPTSYLQVVAYLIKSTNTSTYLIRQLY